MTFLQLFPRPGPDDPYVLVTELGVTHVRMQHVWVTHVRRTLARVTHVLMKHVKGTLVLVIHVWMKPVWVTHLHLHLMLG